MKHSRLMRERVRRTRILFRELGYQVQDAEFEEETYSATFESEDGFGAGLFIEPESRFLELLYTFSLSPRLADFLRVRIEELMRVCYEYGCYFSLQPCSEEIAVTVYSKIYYAGLNYFALKETVRDLRSAIDAVQELLTVTAGSESGVTRGDS